MLCDRRYTEPTGFAGGATRESRPTASALHVDGHEGAAYLSYLLRDPASVRWHAERLLELGDELQDDLAKAKGLHDLALLAGDERDWSRMAELERESADLADGDPWQRYPLDGLAGIEILHGDLDKARGLMEEVHRLSAEHRDPRDEGHSLWTRGFVAVLQGHLHEAKELLTSAIAAGAEIGDRHVIARALDGMAAMHARAGGLTQAADLLGLAEAICDELSLPRDTPLLDRLWEGPELRGVVFPEAQVKQGRQRGKNMDAEGVLDFVTRTTEELASE